MKIEKILLDLEESYQMNFVFELKSASFAEIDLDVDLKEKMHYYKHASMVYQEKEYAELYASYFREVMKTDPKYITSIVR
jgi:hypothetical protein